MNKIAIKVVGEFRENKVWVTVDWVAEVKAHAQVAIWDATARKFVSDVFSGEYKDPWGGEYEHAFQLSILPGTKGGTYSLWAVVLDVNNNQLAEDSRNILVPEVAGARVPWGWIAVVLAALVMLSKRKR